MCQRENRAKQLLRKETLWFSSSRHAAGFPPWDLLQLMPHCTEQERDREPLRLCRSPYWDRENQGLSLLRVISLIPSKSL